jgi:signal transduction histidine kinase/ligand-binding sensor domain-containing protein
MMNRRIVRARALMIALVAAGAGASFACGTSAHGQAVAALSGLHRTSWLVGRDLPLGGVSGVVRTPDGYLWLGSSAGLVRFDGVRFVIIDETAEPALASAPRGVVRPLLVSRDGTMWAARADGAVVAYRDGEFSLAMAPPPSSRVRSIDALHEDARGRMWARVGPRLFRFSGSALVATGFATSAPDTGVVRVLPDTGDGLWIATRTRGLWHVGVSGSASRVTPSSDAAVIVPLLQRRDGTLWVGGKGVWPLGATHSPAPLSAFRCGCQMTEAPDGTLWISSVGAGVLRFRDDVAEAVVPGSPSGSTGVSDMFADAEGNVWVVSDRGLDRFRSSPFRMLGRSDGLPFDVPLSVVASTDGAIWTMDYATLDAWMLSGGVVSGTPTPLTTRRRADGGVLMAAAREGGVWRQALHSDRIVRDDGAALHPLAPEGLTWHTLRRALVDSRGTLWLTWGAGRLARVDGQRATPVALGGASPSGRVTSMVEDGRGQLWFSVASSGLLRFDGQAFTAPFETLVDLRADEMRLAAVAGDTLWAASRRDLIRLTPGRAARVAIPALQTLLGGGTARILASRHDLWLMNEEGVVRLARASLDSAIAGRIAAPHLEWLRDLDGTRPARAVRADPLPAAMARDGRLWFAMPGGLAVIDPERLPRNTMPPVALVEVIERDGASVPMRDRPAIAPRPRRLRIHYTATALRDPERVRVEYRLDGSDSGWVSGSRARTAEYTGLGPGSYTFRVRAWNEDGVPSRDVAMASFEILPAFDQRPTVRLLFGLTLVSVLGGLAVAASRRRVQRAEAATRDRYEAVLRERTRLAGELHDTLLQGFTGLTLQLHAIHARIMTGPADAADELNQLMRVADSTLREARESVWDMRTPELDGPSLTDALQQLLDRSAVRSGAVVTLAVEGAPRSLSVTCESTILRVVRECLANAHRHARASRIEVVLTYADSSVSVLVRDDGVGFDGQVQLGAESGHWGLRGMQERAKAAGGTLSIEGTPGVGTTIRLQVPGV